MNAKFQTPKPQSLQPRASGSEERGVEVRIAGRRFCEDAEEDVNPLSFRSVYFSKKAVIPMDRSLSILEGTGNSVKGVGGHLPIYETQRVLGNLKILMDFCKSIVYRGSCKRCSR